MSEEEKNSEEETQLEYCDLCTKKPLIILPENNGDYRLITIP